MCHACLLLGRDGAPVVRLNLPDWHHGRVWMRRLLPRVRQKAVWSPRQVRSKLLNRHLQMLTCSSSEEEHKSDENASLCSHLLTREEFNNCESPAVSAKAGRELAEKMCQITGLSWSSSLISDSYVFTSEIAMETKTTCRHSIKFTNICLALNDTLKLQVFIPTWQIWRRLRIIRSQWHWLSWTLLNFPQIHQISFLVLAI